MISINNVILNLFQDLVLEKMRCRNKFGMTRIMGGFTLVELMVVLSISAILGTLGIAGFNNYNKTQVLQNAASDLVTTFNTARSRAQSQVKLGSSCSGSSRVLEGYSVDISTTDGSYTLNSHCFLETSKFTDTLEAKKLPDNVSFINVSTASFFFPVITGGVKNAGSVTISGYGMEKNVVVNPYGGISMQLTPTIFPTSTPTPAPLPTSTPTPTSTLTPTPTLVPTSTPTPTPIVYSGTFQGGSAPTYQCVNWDSWRSSLSGTFTRVTFKGSLDPAGVTCTGSQANTICNNLRTGTTTSINCGGKEWMIGSCYGIELNVGVGSVCRCDSGVNTYTIRACINNGNWGSVKGYNSCSAPTQTLTIECAR